MRTRTFDGRNCLQLVPGVHLFTDLEEAGGGVEVELVEGREGYLFLKATI